MTYEKVVEEKKCRNLKQNLFEHKPIGDILYTVVQI